MEKELRKQNGILDNVRNYFEEAAQKRRENTSLWLLDFLTVITAFVLARCHVAFGSYPLALGFLCALPARMTSAVLGAAFGALTLGKVGMPYALVYLLTWLVRAVLCATGDERLFREKLSLKLCVSVLSGFILGIYEILLVGGSFSSVLYAAACVVFPAVACLVYEGLFVFQSLSPESFFAGGRAILGGFRRRQNERWELICFQGSLLLTLLSFGFALREISFFGIGFSYLFATVTVLFTAKRFGALRAMAAGFAVLLAVDPLHAVGFALAGGAAALLLKIGAPYALFGGGAALALWSFYSGGTAALLATFPEYAIGASLFFPLLRLLKTEEVSPGEVCATDAATEMVGTMALSLRGKTEGTARLEEALLGIAPLLRRSGITDSEPLTVGVEQALKEEARLKCRICEHRAVCSGIRDAAVKKAAEKICRGQTPAGEDLFDCAKRDELVSSLQGAANRYFITCAHGGNPDAADVLELVSKLMNEVRLGAGRELELDRTASEKLEKTFLGCGFPTGVVRAFGDRQKTVLAAAQTSDGEKITSPEVRKRFEETLGLVLSKPEFFKKNDTVLFKAVSEKKYAVACAAASSPEANSEISGDVCGMFEGEDGTYYAVICDGMGTGEVARRASDFAVSYLKKILGTGCSKATALSLLNRLLRDGTEECSATVDLFEFDLKGGEGQFFKSGAAPSYLKRGSSIFRIRSQTVPLGVIQNVDAERIRMEILPGDTVVMCSDGVSISPEDSPWLLELLASSPADSPADLARTVVKTAKEKNGAKDDMTVLVAHIDEIPA